MLPLLLFACSKGNRSTNPPPKTDHKTYAAHFTISASSAGNIQTNSLHSNDVTAGDPVANVANELFYYVFNSSGQLITQLVQDSTSTNFGQITDTFEPGTYNIVVVAYKVTAQSQFVAPTTPVSYSTAAFNAQGCDAFFNSFSLTVTNSAVTQTVNLSRVVGQLQVKLTDTIPPGTTSIEVDVVSDLAIAFSTGLPNTTKASTYKLIAVVPAAAIGKPNFTITTYVGNTTSAFTVNLTAKNSAGAFANASATGITCQVNTRTLLSGQLFTAPVGSDTFTVTFDRSWDNNPTTIDF